MYKMQRFYTSSFHLDLGKNPVISRMYKKLYTPEKEPSAEPFCDKGSFLGCVPERGIMLTGFVYNMQPENRKNY
jgi:hypothetical protein